MRSGEFDEICDEKDVKAQEMFWTLLTYTYHFFAIFVRSLPFLEAGVFTQLPLSAYDGSKPPLYFSERFCTLINLQFAVLSIISICFRFHTS